MSLQLMLTLAPRSACMSPLVLSLLIEVLSLQIWSTIQSLNSDYINTTIVSSFGQAVTAVKKVQKAEADRQINGDSEGSGVADQSILVQQADNGRAIQAEPVAETPRTKAAVDLKIGGPPPLPVRKTVVLAAPKPSATQQKRPESISFDSPDHTFAASGLPSYGMMSATSAVYSPQRKSVDLGSSAPGTSTTLRPASVPSSPRGVPARLEDRTIEEAIDHGAAKLRAFGKNLFTAGQKFLDAAIPPDEQSAVAHARQASEGSTHSRRGSMQLGSPRAPSLKGKERALDQDEGEGSSQIGSTNNSSPAASMRSSSMARDPSRKSIASFGSGLGSLISPPSSRPSSIFGSSALASAPASAQTIYTPAHAKLQIAIDILKSKDADRCAHLAKQLERSLFSKDLALLFPAPQDDQLRAILARHTSSEEMVDPSLISISDDFHAFLERDSSGTGERLLRLWTQLDHFGYMVEMTKPTPDQLYDDTIGLLQKTTNQMNDLPLVAEAEEEKAYVTACEMTMLRLQQNPNRDIFEPLQDWLLRCIQEKFWDLFMREKVGKDASATGRPAAHESIPSASTSKRTLDSIPDASSVRLVDDWDLGMTMREDDERSHAISSPSVRSPASPVQALASSADLPTSTSNAEAPSQTLEEPQIPAFSVTLTDLSPPSAYLNNHVKNRKELEFLIAVEVENSPGYIVCITISFMRSR